MNLNEFRSVQLWRFIYIYQLINRVNDFYQEQSEKKYQEYLKNFQGYESWVIQKVKMSGLSTIKDFISFAEEKPKEAFEYNIAELKKTKLSIKKRELEMFSDFFPKITFESLFLISFSTLEYSLKEIIRSLIEATNSECENIDDSDNVFKDFKEIFSEDLRVKFDYGHSHVWQKINERYKIRNQITHNGGIIKKKPKLKCLVEESESISLKNDRIHIEKLFVTETIELMHHLIVELFAEMGKKFT